ncbi:ThiF family adenylyltransferase [Humibacter sp.]|uniref:ThiF family adenylyltransferase n=1 Tax=Humibacter sp. TaxID=1940291 RepID=UPI003F7EAC5C
MVLPPLVEPVDALAPDERVRAARQLRLFEIGDVGQRRLAAARVAVIGAGGLGSPVLLYLASAGVGTLGIVDDDVVDATNLQRQIAFGTTDVGRPKAAVAAERVRELSPHTTVVEIREHLDAANAAHLLTGYDIVVDGSDTFETRYAVADACAALGVPLVWGSVLRFDAQATVFWSRPPTGTTAPETNAAGTTTRPGTTPVAPVNLRDVFPDPPAPEDAPSCADAGVLGALCGQLGGILSAEVVKLVCGVGRTLLGRMLVIDALTATTSEVPLVPSRAQAGKSIPRPLADASRPDAVRRVSVDELSDLSDPAIIDVREPDEFAAGSIPGARSVPLAHLTTDAPLLPLDRPVVVFCQTGPRARIAARTLLAEHPDADIRILDGGYDAWMRVHRRVRA